MEKKVSQKTESYEDKLSDNLVIKLTLVVGHGNVTIHGKANKNGEEVGNVSYDKKSNYIVTQLNPVNSLTAAEILALSQHFVSDVLFILAEENGTATAEEPATSDTATQEAAAEGEKNQEQ